MEASVGEFVDELYALIQARTDILRGYPRGTQRLGPQAALGAAANPQTPLWARHSTPALGEHTTHIIHRARSSHMVHAYAAANVQACGTISGAHGAVDNRERRDLLDLEQQEEEEDVQQDEQQGDERQEEQRGEQQVEQ